MNERSQIQGGKSWILPKEIKPVLLRLSLAGNLRRYDMNGRFQMLEGKHWILPKVMNANRFFWDSHWLEIWSNHLFPSLGPNGGIVAMDSGKTTYLYPSMGVSVAMYSEFGLDPPRFSPVYANRFIILSRIRTQ
jgi:hypothetical protein